MIKTHYKSDLDLKYRKNILSWNSGIKNNELPIIELGWGFIFHLIKHKLKHKIYFLISSNCRNDSNYYDFFYIKNNGTKKTKYKIK